MTDKPKFNSHEVECVVRMHRAQETRLMAARRELLRRGLVTGLDRGFALTLSGKKLTGTT